MGNSDDAKQENDQQTSSSVNFDADKPQQELLAGMPKKKKKNRYLVIGRIVLACVLTLVLGLASSFAVFVSLSYISCLKPHVWTHPPVDVSPLLDLKLPDDIDLSRWEQEKPGKIGVTVESQYFPTLAATDKEFETDAYQSTVGSSPDRYSLDEIRLSIDEFCQSGNPPVYNSSIVIQKGENIIEISETSYEKNSRGIEEAIARLADEWSAAIQSSDYPQILPGRLIFVQKCERCHEVDKFNNAIDRYVISYPEVGPNLYSLYGSQEELTDGSCITADEAYLRRSIMDPMGEIVFCWGMCGHTREQMKDSLSDKQVDWLIEYLISLAETEFKCREMPPFKDENDIVGKWIQIEGIGYSRYRGIFPRMIIKPDGEGGYLTSEGENLPAKFKYDPNQGKYIGSYYEYDKGEWSEPGSLTIEMRDANSMLLTEIHPTITVEWWFIRDY